MASPKSGYKRGGWYGTFRFLPTVNNVFSTLDEKQHDILRNQVTPSFAPTNVNEEKIGAQVMRLVDLISRKFVASGPDAPVIDFAPITHLLALDIIGSVSFGQAFGFLDEGRDVFGFLAWNETYFPFIMPVTLFPGLQQLIFRWPARLLYPKETDLTGLGKFIG
jgi:cytochrome P450